ncbi:two-component system response regulator NarL [Plasticicumulans acidivorans]|uniref:LuxR family two component transcriptional regulator n=1 Tax=Plasticicumulans acidivorans TaxID=886464 RepID=A0A317MU59_9GAMM|nr:two-component system response regulator NarL [Plasticicumulans acidivorans]PWV61175.1 LuxR family two component transcriptional regulator [Plasticicumulans acidivorans]
MSDSPQTLLVIDDHPLLRKGVSQLVALEPEMKLIGEAADGSEGLRLARELNPDLILLDLQMRGVDGLETLKAIKALDLDARVIMFTVSDAEEDVLAALQAGADGYLLKDMEPEEMLNSLRLAARGRLVLSAPITELLARSLRSEQAVGATPVSDLTDREHQILLQIAAGRSNKLIARELNITEGTVKVHVKHLLKKLSLRSRVEAAVWAVKTGIAPRA